MNGPLNNIDAMEVSELEEARAIMRGFRGALASLPGRDRADIATES